MAATQIGASLLVGATTTFSWTNSGNYILVRATEGDKELTKDEIKNSLGALTTIVIYRSLDLITLELICKTGADPVGDFPKGTQVTDSSDATNWYVDDCKVDKTKSPHTATITIRKTNLTTTP